jgi:hypothetical protein
MRHDETRRRAGAGGGQPTRCRRPRIDDRRRPTAAAAATEVPAPLMDDSRMHHTNDAGPFQEGAATALLAADVGSDDGPEALGRAGCRRPRSAPRLSGGGGPGGVGPIGARCRTWRIESTEAGRRRSPLWARADGLHPPGLRSRGLGCRRSAWPGALPRWTVPRVHWVGMAEGPARAATRGPAGTGTEATRGPAGTGTAGTGTAVSRRRGARRRLRRGRRSP